MTLLYTYTGLSETLLREARTRYAADKLVTSRVSGDITRRLFASLAGHAYQPDITMINDNISLYFATKDSFVDLNTLGAGKLKQEYLPWKWNAGANLDGFQLGFPIDIGPVGLYYRYDQFRRAGFPAEPDEVAKALPTWETYFDFGERIQKKIPGAYLITDTKTVFTYSLSQESKKYFDQENHPLDDQTHVRRAWDRALEAFQRHLTSGYAGSQSSTGQSVDQHAAWNTGKELTLVSPSWLTGQIKTAAPGTAGAWRVTRAPGGAGNQGGSFLAITKACPDPEAAFRIVSWLQSPGNQPQNYLDIGLFPPSPSAFTDKRVLVPDRFFGGQSTVEVFGQIAKEVTFAYFGPYDSNISDMYTDELANVELGGKDPKKAWKDARTKVERMLRRQGVLS
jgi:cellobiose transport system substrate-binding protein